MLHAKAGYNLQAAERRASFIKLAITYFVIDPYFAIIAAFAAAINT